jgi:hypothetical protein
VGPLATANHEIREAERHEQERRLARLVEPRRLTDRLLNQLEELNLGDVHLVPDDYEPTLAELRAHLAGWAGVERSLIDRLQSGIGTAELIETVFTIQEVISPPTLPPDALSLDDVEP